MTKRHLFILFSIIGLPLVAYSVFSRASGAKVAQTSQKLSDQESQGIPRIVVATSTPSIVATSTTIKTNALVVRAVDGDTLVVRYDLEDEERKIRLLGINTPETVDPRRPVECFGKEASAHMHQLVEGKRVRLESDPQADERDKYGRLLRIVILEDGTNVNEKMISDGYAFAYVSFPMSRERRARLRQLQKEAQSANRGLWAPETCQGKK